MPLFHLVVCSVHSVALAVQFACATQELRDPDESIAALKLIVPSPAGSDVATSLFSEAPTSLSALQLSYGVAKLMSESHAEGAGSDGDAGCAGGTAKSGQHAWLKALHAEGEKSWASDPRYNLLSGRADAASEPSSSGGEGVELDAASLADAVASGAGGLSPSSSAHILRKVSGTELNVL